MTACERRSPQGRRVCAVNVLAGVSPVPVGRAQSLARLTRPDAMNYPQGKYSSEKPTDAFKVTQLVPHQSQQPNRGLRLQVPAPRNGLLPNRSWGPLPS